MKRRPDQHPMSSAAEQRNRRVGAVAASVAVVMLGMAYAAVPLYNMFCRATGYGGTTQRVIAASPRVLDRTVTVRFDANVTPGMGWTFEPVARTIDVKLGETTLAFYRATNMTDHAITGSAVFNVAPEIAGIHFNKIECFCFKEQTLKSGETVEMPVSFYVDPGLVDDKDASWLTQITLSYTFYPVDRPKAAAAPQSTNVAGGKS
jgi:cytochrome c oxidase assembly protein subunit 11